LVLASIVFFAVGSIVAAVATNFTMMLVGRSIQGIGGGGILTLGEILVTDLVPLAVRGGALLVLHYCKYSADNFKPGLVTSALCGRLEV